MLLLCGLSEEEIKLIVESLWLRYKKRAKREEAGQNFAGLLLSLPPPAPTLGLNEVKIIVCQPHRDLKSFVCPTLVGN